MRGLLGAQKYYMSPTKMALSILNMDDTQTAAKLFVRSFVRSVKIRCSMCRNGAEFCFHLFIS